MIPVPNPFAVYTASQVQSVLAYYTDCYERELIDEDEFRTLAQPFLSWVRTGDDPTYADATVAAMCSICKVP